MFGLKGQPKATILGGLSGQICALGVVSAIPEKQALPLLCHMAVAQNLTRGGGKPRVLVPLFPTYRLGNPFGKFRFFEPQPEVPELDMSTAWPCHMSHARALTLGCPAIPLSPPGRPFFPEPQAQRAACFWATWIYFARSWLMEMKTLG